MAFHVGSEIDPDVILPAIINGKERIKDHGDYLELTDFVFFQYGVLSRDCNPHKPIIDLLDRYKNKGYFKGTLTLPRRVEDKTRQDNISNKGDFLTSLRSNPAYKHIDFDVEFGKMDQWMRLPKNKNRKKTPRFILNWLNKIEVPVGVFVASKKERKPSSTCTACNGTGFIPETNGRPKIKCWCY